MGNSTFVPVITGSQSTSHGEGGPGQDFERPSEPVMIVGQKMAH